MRPTWKMPTLKLLAANKKLTKEERSAVLWAITTLETRRRIDAPHEIPLATTCLSSETRS